MRKTGGVYNVEDSNFLFRVIYVISIDSDLSLGSLEIFKISLKSLIESLQFPTAITIIDNNSDLHTKRYLNELLEKKMIDRLITNSRNKGKLNPLFSEFNSTSEKLVTFTDGDVFFRKNWQLETIELFNAVSNVGYVGLMPLPSLSLNFTNSFWLRYLLRDIAVNFSPNPDLYGLQLFQDSIWGESVISEKDKFCYIAQKNGKSFIPGAGHVAGTYYREVVKCCFKLINDNNWRGAEQKYLDPISDKNGFLRISTLNFFALHLGNSLTISEKECIQRDNQIELIQTTIPFEYKSNYLLRFLNKKINSYKLSMMIRKIILQF
jgi:hypothetical protein